MTIIGFVVMVAPNGKDRVKVYPHGYIQMDTEIEDKTWSLIQEFSQKAFSMVGPKGTPKQAFELMGWKEV